MVLKKMLFLTLIIFFFLLTSFSCSPSSTFKKESQNIWNDSTMQTIYNFQNERNTEELLPYLKNENPIYRKQAALAFASTQDAEAINSLIPLLDDKDDQVCGAAAYALGQIGKDNAEKALISSAQKQYSEQTLIFILEAIGKCATPTGLDYLINLPSEKITEGQALGIYRAMLHSIISDKGTAKIINFLDKKHNDRTRFFAAAYLQRIRKVDLSIYQKTIVDALNSEKNIDIKIFLAGSFNKIINTEAAAFLSSIISSNIDYRVKVNALRALRNFPYTDQKQTLFNTLKNKSANYHVAVTAAESIQTADVKDDVREIFTIAKTHKIALVQAMLLGTILRLSENDENLSDAINKAIMQLYTDSNDIYEKSNLLLALGSNSLNKDFIVQETFNNVGNVIGTNGLTALTGFTDYINKSEANKKEMFNLLIRAIKTGDTSFISTACYLLGDENYGFKTLSANIDFLKQAIEKSVIPRDIEGYLELIKVYELFSGKKFSDKAILKNSPIDWNIVSSLKNRQQVIIKTSKGNITIELFTNESPGSAANLIKLIKDNYYQNIFFHRVVSNFVIQAGCYRGDGYGGPDYIIGSEFGPLNYNEGYVGMASAGKDTEGSQWFITHSPTPHLDGRYSIFGRVVSGMNVVHKIVQGDTIVGFIIK